MKILGMDHYFHIGHAHLSAGKPCQDYAWSEGNEASAITIVADGCSSGTHTDIGARLLTLATARALRERPFQHDPQWLVAVKTRRNEILAHTVSALAIPTQSLLSTCLFGAFTSEGGVVHVEGDGVVALKYRDRIDLFLFEWKDNRPFYPAYGSDDRKRFIADHGNDVAAKRFHEEYVTCFSDGSYSEAVAYEHSLAEGMAGMTLYLPSATQETELEYVAVLTDGVTQIDRVDWREAVVSFLSFKSACGAFAKRRMHSGIREAEKTGKGPMDDIGYAVVRFGTNEFFGDER